MSNLSTTSAVIFSGECLTDVANHHAAFSCQSPDVDGGEDEVVAEGEDEAGVARGDNQQVARVLPYTSLFVQDFFFTEETFCDFFVLFYGVFFPCIFVQLLFGFILYIKILLTRIHLTVYYCCITSRVCHRLKFALHVDKISLHIKLYSPSDTKLN